MRQPTAARKAEAVADGQQAAPLSLPDANRTGGEECYPGSSRSTIVLKANPGCGPPETT